MLTLTWAQARGERIDNDEERVGGGDFDAHVETSAGATSRSSANDTRAPGRLQKGDRSEGGMRTHAEAMRLWLAKCLGSALWGRGEGEDRRGIARAPGLFSCLGHMLRRCAKSLSRQ